MIFGYSIGYMFIKKKVLEVYSHQRCGTSMEARKRPERGLIFGAEPSQILCKLLGRSPHRLARNPQASPLLQQHSCAPAGYTTLARAGEKTLEGYRLIEGAFHRNLQVYDYFCIDCGNEATGFTVFTCQCIVSYFSIRHSPEQRYRLIRPQSLRSRCLYQLSTRIDCT